MVELGMQIGDLSRVLVCPWMVNAMTLYNIE